MIENFIPNGFVAKHSISEAPHDTDWVFYFIDNNLLLLANGTIPAWKDIKDLLHGHSFELYHFGDLHQHRCFIIDHLDAAITGNTRFVVRLIRACEATLTNDLLRVAGLGCQLHYWRSTHRCCGHCGSVTTDKCDERAKICPQCQQISYPQLYPCIIVLVTRGPELLLARSPYFQAGVYSTLAGFIEPGESAENAVHREVKEEVNIQVKNIRYVLSQPWPFPNSLMLGFIAEYEQGEIVIDQVEIEDARWFKADDLPTLPSHLSISRLIIDGYLTAQGSK